MKKILLTIGYFILIIVSSVMIIRYAYNAYLIHQYNRQNYNVTSTPLTLLNFTESYIVHYNQGNIYYKQGNYEDAIRAYNIALALRMPKKKECDVRVNLALAMLGTIKDTYADLSYAEETKQVVTQGMHNLTTGSLSGAFRDCVVSAGAKTGSAQVGTDIANGVFVCYAPYEDPEIAVAIVIEKGGAGAALASTAVEIINAYFTASGDGGVTPENTLLK